MSRRGARVLVVSGSAGHGHTMAGEALEAAFRLHPAPVDVEHWDAVEGMTRAYAHVYRKGYIRLVDRHPMLWRWVYEQTDQRLSRVTHALTRLAARHFVDRVRAWRPDAIVCTHFLAPEVFQRPMARGQLTTSLHAVVTDHDAHRVWAWPAVARYHVASDLVAARFTLRHRVPASRIHVSGIPVRPQFAEVQDLRAVRATWGLDPRRPVVLFLSGGFAVGDLPAAIHGVWLERHDVQIVAVCGRNERLRRRVARLPRPTGAVLHPLGFVRDVASLMAVADLVVAKSGGITVSECLAMGRPLVVSASIAGQEERNADAVLEAGAGVRAPTVEEVRWRVGQLLGDEAARAAMAARAAAAGRPEAARRIVQDVLTGLGVAAPEAGPWFHGAGRV